MIAVVNVDDRNALNEPCIREGHFGPKGVDPVLGDFGILSLCSYRPVTDRAYTQKDNRR
jgi:hypothetical protein